MLWLTDTREFPMPAGKVYLSLLIDCFDGMPVAQAFGTSPNAELANTMLKKAILHSDRGYRCRVRFCSGRIKTALCRHL